MTIHPSILFEWLKSLFGLRSKPNRVAFLSRLLDLNKQQESTAKQDNGAPAGVEEEKNENSTGLGAINAVQKLVNAKAALSKWKIRPQTALVHKDKWIEEQEDTVTSVAISGDFVAWATQAKMETDDSIAKLSYCLILKKRPSEKKVTLFVTQILQDIAFDQRDPPSRLVAVGYDKMIYVLHVDDIHYPNTSAVATWTLQKKLECMGVPTAISLISNLIIMSGDGRDLIGVGTTTGNILFYEYNAAEKELESSTQCLKSRADKVVGLKFLKASKTEKLKENCACGWKCNEHVHVVVADRSGQLTVMRVFGFQSEKYNIEIEFEQKIDLNVESGAIVAGSDRGDRFVVACGDSKARIYCLAVRKGLKEENSKIQIPQMAWDYVSEYLTEFATLWKEFKDAWARVYRRHYDYEQIDVAVDNEEPNTLENTSDQMKHLSESQGGGLDESIYLWELLYTFDVHGVPLSVSISGDGKAIAVGKEDHECAVYDVDSGCKINGFLCEGRVRSVALDKKGEHLLVGGFDKKLRQYRLQAGFEERISFSLPHMIIHSVSMDDKGQYIGIGTGDGHAFLFSLEQPLFGRHSKSDIDISTSDSNHELENLVMVDSSNELKPVYVVKLSPDGTIFSYGDYDNKVKFFYVPPLNKTSLSDPSPFKFYEYDCKGSPGFVWGLDIKMHVGSYIVAVGSWNTSAYVLRFNKAGIDELELRDKQVLPDVVWDFPQTDRVFDVALSDAGSILIVGSRDSRVRLYDMDLEAYSSAPTGHGSDFLHTTDVQPKIVKDSQCFACVEDDDKVYCVAMSPKGQYFAYGGISKKVRVHELIKHEGKVPSHFHKFLVAYSHKGTVHRIKFIDDLHLAAISDDGRCSLYSVNSKLPILQLRVAGIGNSVALTNDSKTQVLAIAHGHSVTVYGKHFGYGPLDHPSIDLARTMLNDPESLKVALAKHPSMTNAVDKTRKSLLSFAVEDENKVAVDILLNSDEPSGLIMQSFKHKWNDQPEWNLNKELNMFKSPLTIAIGNKDRNMVEKILSAINANKISRTEGLFLKGFFSVYRKGPDLTNCSTGTTRKRYSIAVPDTKSTQKKEWHTVFEDIAELCPATLLKFLASFDLEECEPEVLGDLESAVIASRVYVGHPFRSPAGFWKKYYMAANEASKNNKSVEESFQVSIPENLVQAMRIPIPGMCGFSKGNTAENFRPLEIILNASTSLKEFSVFGKASIVYDVVNFHWTLIESYFLQLFWKYLLYLALCVWLGWSLSKGSGTFDLLPFSLSILLFFVSWKYLVWELRQFLVEFKSNHDLEPGKRLKAAFQVHFFDLWNAIDFCAFTAQITTDLLIIFFRTHTRLILSWAAVAILLLFLKVFFYARAHPLFGPFVRMIQRTMSGMRNFLLVMVIFILGFALAFNVLLGDVPGFTSVSDAFFSTLLMVYGDFSPLENSDYPETDLTRLSLSTVLFNVMNLFCSVTMLNLLVAILSSSYEAVNENSNQESIAQLASIIVETQKMQKISTQTELKFRKWVHVLKPVPMQAIVESESDILYFKKETKDTLAQLMEEIQSVKQIVETKQPEI